MKLAVALGSSLLIFAATSHAQENLVGKYSGTFMQQTQSRGIIPIGISLEITNAADGKLQAKVLRSAQRMAGQGCAGEYKLEGTYEGNKIEMKSEPGGRGNECILQFHLVAEGNKLKGKMGKSDVEFSK
jgi:hypothetical protein